MKSDCDDAECDGVMHFCYECGGDGFLVAECGEDSCCCRDPEESHGYVTCHICSGAGAWPCPSSGSTERERVRGEERRGK